MAKNTVLKNLGENSPIFETTVNLLMPCPHPRLNHQLLGEGVVVQWALDLVRVPMVANVGLNSLLPLKEVGKNGIKNLDVWPLAGRVWTLNPDEVPPLDVYAQLVA